MAMNGANALIHLYIYICVCVCVCVDRCLFLLPILIIFVFKKGIIRIIKNHDNFNLMGIVIFTKIIISL